MERNDIIKIESGLYRILSIDIDRVLASSAYRTSVDGAVLHSNACAGSYRFDSVIWIKKIKLKKFQKVLARSQQPPASM